MEVSSSFKSTLPKKHKSLKKEAASLVPGIRVAGARDKQGGSWRILMKLCRIDALRLTWDGELRCGLLFKHLVQQEFQNVLKVRQGLVRRGEVVGDAWEAGG